MTKNQTDPHLLLMGRIGAAHGIRGEVRIKSFTQDPLSIADYGPLIGKWEKKPQISDTQIKIKKARMSKQMVIATLEGVDSREAAELLNGIDLYVPRDRIEQSVNEDEFLAADLIGLALKLQNGTLFGTIKAIENFGADDVIDVTLARGGSQYFPFTKKIVPEIDLDAGFATIVPPMEIIGDEDKDPNPDQSAIIAKDVGE